MKQFKINAASCSQIMNKSDKILKGTESFCKDWVKEQLYNRKKSFSNKYTEKGLIMEDQAIDFVADFLNLGLLLKNQDSFENEFMKGTPDVILSDLIIDVKCSWDVFTFPYFDNDVNDSYYWQAQVYMALTGRKYYKLIYCLMDTPYNLIRKEAYYHAINNGYDELTEEIYNEFESKMTYPDIPDYLKIKIYDIERNDQDIKRIEDQVLRCRDYICTIQEL